MTPQSAASALDDAFDLAPETTDLSSIGSALADSEPCTQDGCGPSPTTGPTTGCAAPDGPVLGNGGGCNLV
ncbi:hypothetical protein [Streptomyces sp. NBC_01803]|uniref:hypothetical protein n=1 Tax=Streptomyces sp. NBC_01803 TaxID=2975946 RepID=UPI002DDC6F53|nr:hypothetical protein [Streptomyces sp. NBC_01803]WSA46193.1 hypothetical protein OIE51_19565 [Streptomyces sp. NBC_01803]